MSRPRVLVTGATGFIGRHVVAALEREFDIHALARRSPSEARAPEGSSIRWHQVDLGDDGTMDAVFDAIAAAGGVDFVIHLAAYYDFAGRDDPEYQRTNVDRLRAVLERCRRLKPKLFVFASSLAGCEFPAPGLVLREDSPLDSRHPYAVSKRKGEALLAEYAADFPSVSVRLGAVFSDWCEFTPLYTLLRTWVSDSWKASILAGRGTAALPYIHVREVVAFLKRVLGRWADLGNGEVLIAAPDQASSHRQLFEIAMESFTGQRISPRLMPKAFIRPGLWALGLLGKLVGDPPFEKPWMANYVDKAMPVDASQTRQRLGWEPSPRFGVIRRMPFLIENLKTQPLEWSRRNLAAMKVGQQSVPTNLRIFQLLDTHERALVDEAVRACLAPERAQRFPSYQRLPEADVVSAAQQTYAHLKNAVRTKERALFRAHCEQLALKRHAAGFPREEVVDLVSLKRDATLRVLLKDPRARGIESAIVELITGAFRMGIDQLDDSFDELSGQFVPVEPPG